MGLKLFLKNNFFTRGIYKKLKRVKDNYLYKKELTYINHFYNRSQNNKYLCIVLAGYKEFAYNAVFFRLKKYIMNDMDVCVVSSGIHSERLKKICEENGWSYLSVKKNNVCLVQNIALKLHPKAQYIFKLDEDVFITKNYFNNMIKAYNHSKKGDYIPGIVAPLLLINGYSHLRILKKLNLENVYEERFEKPKYAAGQERQIQSNPEVAKFMWGATGEVPQLDKLNEMFMNNPLEEKACPVRFSIGAILFNRSLWENMDHFKVDKNGPGMGDDENQICYHCMSSSRPILVSENVVVGHLSFGQQNEAMKKYFLENEDDFYPDER